MSFIKSPFKVVPKKPQNNIVDISLLVEKIKELNDAVNEVQDIKKQIIEEHQTNQEKIRVENNKRIAELEASVIDVLNSIPIPEAEKVDYEKVISNVIKKIPPPPEIDTLEIAKAAAKFVKVPKVEIPKIEIPKPKEIDHEEVANQVLSIIEKGKKKLSLKHIGDFTDGLEQTLRPIRSLMAGFRGGGDVVKAGSNITITTDADGKKVITSTGFTALAATETPNGILTVFTFASATAQPTYLVVDNVWMKATTAAGTVNWTWNNGTKQATLTVPASDDIWGVV